MLVVTKEQTGQNLIVTLNETKTIATPWYLFIFTCVATKATVTMRKLWDEDTSSYPERFNSFALDETIFNEADVGDWTYDIYEQTRYNNILPDGLNKLECGKMILKPATEITRNGYTPEPETAKGYSG